MIPVALSIAGSDPSGGAGIQADLKTFHAHGVYGQAVLSLWTVQNTRGVSRVQPLPPADVVAQLRAIMEDMPPSAIKTGALGDPGTVAELGASLRAQSAPWVVDPVLVSSSGRSFGGEAMAAALLEHLVPGCALLTPNAPEACALTGLAVTCPRSAERAARALCDRGARAVLVKGGHFEGAPLDVLVSGADRLVLPGERRPNRDTHGTGCTYSAAITARLALGHPLTDAVRGARDWLAQVMDRPLGLGKGCGPLNHLVPVR